MTSSNTEYAELIERLRMWPATEGRGDALEAGFVGQLLTEAATALERLSSDREMLRETLAAAKSWIEQDCEVMGPMETILHRKVLSRINTALGDSE